MTICKPERRQWLSLLIAALFAVAAFAATWMVCNELMLPGTKLSHKLMCGGCIAVLVGILTYIVSAEFQRDSVSETERPCWFYPLASGLLSLFAMWVAYSFMGMWPFGEKTGMVVDMHHQYAPLLAGLRDNILSGELSTYSFEVGLGTNYVSLFAYYLGSPLNLLLLLFPERFLAEGILLITLIKNALCGGFFALCVQTVFRKKSLLIPTVSVMYSLMMYLLAYSWNIMWLDVVMMLPIVILGFERLMHTGKYLTYVLSLAYCLIVNYYIGFMLCIFMVLYYVAYVLRAPRTGRELGISFARVAGFSVLGVGLAAVILVPVYIALQSTSAAGGTLPDADSSIDIFALLGRHLAGTSPTIRSGNLPNLYCGVLAAICVPLFAMNKGISVRRRATYMGLWLVMALTFTVNITDLLWHGLHAPNDLPYRFSFLYSFLLLLMAYETLTHLREITVKQLGGVLAGAVLYLVLEQRFGGEEYGFEEIYINLALVGIYTLLLAVATRPAVRTRVAHAALLLTVTLELTVNGGAGLLQVNSKEYFTNHNNYLDNETSITVGAAVNRAQAIGNLEMQGDFFRVEFLPRRTCVDTALFGYRGITTFSSSNYYTTTKLMGGWGYAINGVNSHLYHSFVPFTDSLLGIRYVVLNVDLNSHPQLKKRETVSLGDTTYYVYENTDALGLGYVADAKIKDYSYTLYSPFTSLNDLYRSLTGDTEALYDFHHITLENGAGSVTYESNSFRVSPDEATDYASFTATVPEGGQVFLYADCMAAESMSITSGDGDYWSVSPHEPYIIDGGTVHAGETFTLDVTAEGDCSGNFYVVTMNTERYENCMQQLKDDQLVVSSFSNTHIVGSVDASRDGAMMTSIPYDKGWTVKVDGTAVETYGIDEGFLAFDITAGEHEVTFSYSPVGMTVGVCISAVSAAALIALVLIERLRKRKEQAAATVVKPESDETVIEPTEAEPVDVSADEPVDTPAEN